MKKFKKSLFELRFFAYGGILGVIFNLTLSIIGLSTGVLPSLLLLLLIALVSYPIISMLDKKLFKDK